jgi:predicted aspartyl protease
MNHHLPRNGRRGPVSILAFKDAIPVIGVDTLETLGLKVDPVTGRIEKTEYYMLYTAFNPLA